MLAKEAPPLLHADDVILVLVWGQSNAKGTNSWLADATWSNWSDVANNAFIWDMGKRWIQNSHYFTDDLAGNPIPGHEGEYPEFRPIMAGYGASGKNYPWDSQDLYPVGPEMQLAKRLLGWARRPVYIVKCAIGDSVVADRGASLGDWNVAGLTSGPGGVPKELSYLHLFKNYYYGPAIWRMVNTLGILRERIKFAGVCQMIGASDANNETYANAYAANLTAIINSVRGQIQPGNPNSIPWVIGGIEDYYTTGGVPTAPHTYVATVAAAQHSVAASMQNVLVAPTNDIEREDDATHGPGAGEHFTGNGQLQLGNLFYGALRRFSLATNPRGDVSPV